MVQYHYPNLNRIRVIYEFQNETAAGHLRSWIDKNNFYDGIVEIKVRK
ncbi:hypothetical protein [Fusobacterium pseudoperiodonticum]|nr:hypothetical protein [Fusobacterium pseudoperiodonticum]